MPFRAVLRNTGRFSRTVLAGAVAVALINGSAPSPATAAPKPKVQRGFSISSPTVTEGNGGVTNLVFTVTMTGSISKTATVRYATASRTATTPADYAPASGQLTFPKGATTRQVTVTVFGDLIDEVDETLVVSLSQATRTKILTGQGTGTILDDDAPPVVRVEPASAPEGEPGANTTLAFPIRLDGPSGLPVSVVVSTSSAAAAVGVAAAGADYTSVGPTTVTLPPGQTSATVLVTVIGDTLGEGDETFTLTISSPLNAVLGTSSAIGTIIDNEPLTTWRVSIADRTNVEGATFTFPITISPAAPTAFQLRYDVLADEAKTPADLPEIVDGVLDVAAGATLAFIDVVTTDDAFDELDEDFLVNLRLGTPTGGASLFDAQAVGTITDNDLPPSVSVFDTEVSEGDTTDNPNFAYFTVHLSDESGLPTSVHVATQDGSAIAGADYTAVSEDVLFPAGSTDRTVAVPILGNLDDQPDKTFSLVLSAPSSLTIDRGAAVATILDDEAADLPVISVDDPTVTEGDTGTYQIPFTVSLSDFSDSTVTVHYTVTSSALPSPLQGDLTFEPGDTQLVVAVPAAGNTTPNSNLTYTLTFSPPSNGQISLTDGVGTATVVDNDAASPTPTNSVRVADASVTEGDGSPTVLKFVVSLASPAAVPYAVDYATAGWTALENDDFEPVADTLNFAAGQQVKVVLVAVEADNDTEPDELLLLDLTSPSAGLAIADGQAVGTIFDDDPATTALTLSIGDDVVQESASATAAHFLVSLSGPAPAGGIAFTWATVADAATSPADFAASTGGGLIPAGQQTFTIPVTIIGDAHVDPATEQFFVDIATSAAGVTIADGRGVGTIIDNTALLPVVSIGNVTVHNGETPGSVVVTVPVSLDHAGDDVITVHYSIPSPIAGDPPITGTITIPAGQTSGVGTTTLAGTNTGTVAGSAVSITDATSAVVNPSDATSTPAVLPVVSISGVVVNPGTTPGTSIVVVTATLDQPTDHDVAVVITIPPAQSGGTPTSVTVTVPAGATSGSNQVVVPGTPSAIAGTDVTIASVTGAMPSPSDDAFRPVVVDLPIVHVDDVVVNPGATPGTSIVVVTVSLDQPSATDVIIEFTVPPATPGGTPTTGTVVIPAGATTAQGSVVVTGTPAQVAGAPVSLTDAAGAVIDPTDSSQAPTVVDLPIVSIGNVIVSDSGTPGSVVVVIPVFLDGPSNVPVTVTYSIPSTTGGAPTTGTITIPAGAVAETVQVTVPGTTTQVSQSTVTLTGATNAVVDPTDAGDAPAVVDLPVVTIGNVTVSPGTQPGTVIVTVPVTIDQPSSVPVTVEFTVPSTTGGAPTTGTITIVPGATSGVGTVTVPGNTTTSVPGPVTLTDSTGSVINVGDASDVPSVVIQTTTPGGGSTGGGSTGGGSTGGGITRPLDRFKKVATGYRMVASDGGIFTFGDAPFLGSTGDIKLNKPIVGMATTPSGDGYWLVATDGGIFTFGDANFFGSTGALRLNRPIVGMETTPSGQGYWLVADDGGIFAFGDAAFQGSTGAIKLNKPIVGMETTPTGLGYWLVATDGGIFAFGDAEFLGSTGAIRLNQPIVGMAASPSGAGYRLVATDGGIFAFGDAEFLGSTGAIRLNRPIVGMAASPTGAGYWLVATDGGIFTFGDVEFLGSTGDIRLNQPINGMAPVVRTVKVD